MYNYRINQYLETINVVFYGLPSRLEKNLKVVLSLRSTVSKSTGLTSF